MTPRSVGSVSVSVVPDATGFSAKLSAKIVPGSDEIGAQLGRAIGSSMVDALEPSFEHIRLRLDELGTKDVNIRVKIDDNGGLARTEAEIAAVDASAGSSGNGFNIFGSKIANIGGLAIAAADIAIPAILAIGAAAAGALAGVGVLALGFSGIGAALQAHGQKTPGGGTGVASAGLGQQSAQISAQQATKSAQDQLTQAIQAQAKAEVALHLARVQALQDLQDLDNKLKDNTLSQAQAAINLRIAQQTLAVTLNAPGATQVQYANQVAQAKLNVATAQQKVNELTLEGTRLTVQDATAHKNGINGAPSVVSAQQSLLDANHKLAEAQANIGITAQKNAIALQQAALGMTSAAAGANAFATAMSKLNPIQQQFVDFLLKMKPLLDQIKLAASQFLPGIEQGIKNAAPAFGPILAIVGNVAKAMGTVFANIGTQFATPAGQKFLNFLSVELPKQILFLGNLFIDLGKILSGIFQAAAPLIAAFDQALLGMLGSMGKAANGGGLKTFFDSLIPLVKPTFEALGAVGKLISAILKAIAPALPAVLDVITQLATALTTLVTGQAGQMLVQTFIDLLTVLGPIIKFVEQLFIDLPQLAPILLLTAVAVKAWAVVQAVLNVLLDTNPIVLIVAAIGVLVVAFIEAYKHSQTFRTIVQAAFEGVRLVIAVAMLEIRPLIVGFSALITGIGVVVSAVMRGIVTVFHNIAGPIKTAFSAVWDGVKTVWNDVEGFFKGIANGIIHVINDMIDLLDKIHIHVPHIIGTNIGGDIGFNIKPIPYLAAGAIVKPTPGGTLARLAEAGVAEAVMPLPKLADLVNKLASVQHINGGGGRQYTFNNYGQSDPVATSHQVANRFQARGV